MAKVYFVGAGPGDAELITVKGARLLAEADLVVYAGSLVDRALVQNYIRNARVLDSSAMTLEETNAALVEAHVAGGIAVRLHTGDPAIYGAIQEQMAALDEAGVPYEVVPGVTSAFAAAAALKQELTLPEVSQTVIITRLAGRTPVPERERLSGLAGSGATLVVYLSVAMIDQVVAECLAGGRTEETPAAVVARASWPDQLIVEGTLTDIGEKVRGAAIGKQAVIIVGDVLKARTQGLKAKSLLYDKEFSHEYRKGTLT